MTNIEQIKKLVCVTMSSLSVNPGRDAQRRHALSNFLSFGNVDMIIDTDKEEMRKHIEDLGLEGSVEVFVHDNLESPRHLAWIHREHMAERLERYDYFLYSEDDILLPYEGFCYSVNTADALWPIAVPGFATFETKNGCLYNVDCWLQTIISKSQIFEAAGERFIPNLMNNHLPLWMLSQKHLKQSINGPFTNIGGPFIRRLDWIEPSSWFLAFDLGKLIAIKLTENNQLHKDCCIHHLDNKWVNVPDSPHGKIKLEDLIKIVE